jgi:hypothetical protein
MMDAQDYEFIAILLTADIVLFALPIALIARRMGLSAWWGLLVFSGPFLFVGLWVLAIRGWPSLQGQNSN